MVTWDRRTRKKRRRRRKRTRRGRKRRKRSRRRRKIRRRKRTATATTAITTKAGITTTAVNKYTYLFQDVGYVLSLLEGLIVLLWQEDDPFYQPSTLRPNVSLDSLHTCITKQCTPVTLYIIIIIYSLTAMVVWAPQMISQPVFSNFLCSPLPSGTCRTPGLSIPWCCLPTSSSVCLVLFPLSLCLARWFWPDLMKGKHDNTTANIVCVSLRSSGGLRVVQLPAGSWHRLPRW